MISKLPSWVWSGAWLLAFVAGMVNVAGLLGFDRHSITHHTGNTSLLAEALARGNLAEMGQVAAIIAAFVVGCALSGYLVQDSTLQLGRRYSVALLLAAVLLASAVPLLQSRSNLGMVLAAGACGLQNAMVSAYSGAVVRTTHLTGMFTDLGIFLGHALRGLPVDRRRLKLCISVITGFLCGSFAGAIAFDRLGFASLYFPAALTACASIAYAIYRMRLRRQRIAD